MLRLLFIVGLAMPAHVVAAAPPAAIVPTAKGVLALELSTLLNNEQLTRAQLAKMLGDSLPKIMAQDPSIAVLERQYPGAINVTVETLRPIITNYLVGALPEIWGQIGAIISRELTITEIEELLRFYKSPTGVRIIDAMARGADFSQSMRRYFNNDQAKMTTTDLLQGIQPGIAEIVRVVTPEDQQKMKAMISTPAGQKLIRLTPEMQSIVVAWSNKQSPEIESRAERMVVEALRHHIEKSK